MLEWFGSRERLVSGMSEKSTIDEVGFQGFEKSFEQALGLLGDLETCACQGPTGAPYPARVATDIRGHIHRMSAQHMELREALEVETSRVEALQAENAQLREKILELAAEGKSLTTQLDEEKRMVMALAGVLEEERRGRNGNARLQVATAALQGMLAGAVETDGLPAAFDLNLAAWAVKHADALLEELGREGGIQHKDD